MKTWTELSEGEIRGLLANLARRPPRNPYPVNYFNRPRRRAAVLIPFTRIGPEWHLLFIRRSENEHDHHRGQVAFPGGGQDPVDANIEATALREAREEVGLQPGDVEILGALDDVISITNYHVTPIVGCFHSPYPFHQDQREVARIFTIPFSWLADPSNHETRYRQVDGHDPWPVIYFDRYDGELLWGFTAALTLRLIESLGG